jgi:hypothetical protein
VNAGNGVRLVSDQPAGDAGAQITAVRYVAVMTQPHGHQGVPQASDLTPGQPGGGGGPLNPQPGSDRTITVKASAGSAPCAPGSDSNGISLIYSRNDPDQPWVSSSGSGFGP